MQKLADALGAAGLEYYAVLPESQFSFPPYRTAAICLLPYFTEGKGNLSVYARGRDYHKVARERLAAVTQQCYGEDAAEECVFFCDVSPIDEVRLAAQAGMGVVGDNGLLLTTQFGAYVFICELFIKEKLTDAIVYSEQFQPTERQGCLHCGRCDKSCPGGAIQNGFHLERCLSHISQKRGALSLEEEALLRKGKLIWGCDVCQTVCPLSKGTEAGNRFFRDALFQDVGEETLNGLSDRAFRKKYSDRAFSFRGIAPLKRNLKLFLKK